MKPESDPAGGDGAFRFGPLSADPSPPRFTTSCSTLLPCFLLVACMWLGAPAARAQEPPAADTAERARGADRPAGAHAGHGAGHAREGRAAGAAVSPYAGLEGRDPAGLSEEERRALLAGEGFGFALPAELNGVPGPRHALELGDELGLSPAQARDLEAIESAMRSAAIELGEAIVALERELDGLFAGEGATQGEVERLTRRIGVRRGQLRAVHLVAHLRTEEVLTPEQVRRYAELRGYHAHREP